ncbi:hypothetical protein [Arthrobacter sp. A5]|uniref:hypothetical protein n=1 Tax=Arthrobacter sp. A5 TaxID=576926 RepID=UPI003DA946C9
MAAPFGHPKKNVRFGEHVAAQVAEHLAVFERLALTKPVRISVQSHFAPFDTIDCSARPLGLFRALTDDGLATLSTGSKLPMPFLQGTRALSQPAQKGERRVGLDKEA